MAPMPEPSGAYDDLEPGRPTPVDPRTREPGGITILLRALTRRCPRCGGGGLFERWLRIRDRCPTCALRLEREEGGFLGGMVINYAVTAAVWLVVFVVWLTLDLPDVHVAALTVVSIGIAVLVPLAFYPFSKTLWAAVDYLVYRSTPEYRTRDAGERASGNGGRYTEKPD
jgi:uncharacterized protein (DUF983 family)